MRITALVGASSGPYTLIASRILPWANSIQNCNDLTRPLKLVPG